MRKKEALSLVEYFYTKQIRLENDVTDCALKYIRREMDSVDLLEEIIAKERLRMFDEVMREVLHILELSETFDT